MKAEEWRSRKLGDFAVRSKIINLDGAQLPPLSITKGRGVVLQSEKYKKQIATDLRKYVIARRDQFAFDPMSLYYGAIGQVESIDIGVVSPDYVVFDVDDTVDKRFLNFLLRSPEQVAVYETVAETGNSFGKRRRVYWSVLEQLELRLPPLAEQQKIATILSSLDDAIEATQAVNDQLQVVKKAIVAELLTRGLPGRHTRFKQTEIGEVPENWEVIELAALCTEPGRYGANVPKGPYVPSLPRYVRITDITEDGDLNHEAVSISEADAAPYVLSEGDVLFARSGATVGKSYVYAPEHGRCAHAGYLIRFRPDASRLLSRFLGFVAQSERYWKWVGDMRRTGAQPNINAVEFGSFLIPVPSVSEQREIVEVLSCLDARRSCEAAALDALTATKSALMSVLLSGEVRVTVDELST